MQDPADPAGTAAPEAGGRDGGAAPPGTDGPEEAADSGAPAASTVLAEVLPGIAVVLGEVPPELAPELVDFGLVPAVDRARLAAVLASVGGAATAAGALGDAVAGVQGLYRLSDATRALLKAGATLAAKDGANLGTVMVPGRILAQARFLPVTSVSMAQNAASLGPALAMVGLQMQLSEVTGLVRTNIALTGQVLAALRKEQWSELAGLVTTVDRAVDQARKAETVPTSLWESVAGSQTLLDKQLDLYRRNVRDHVRQIDGAGPRHRREYLQANAEAIVFDAYALLSSLKAWTGYQALRAARARATGRDDADEARFVGIVARDTRAELDSALAATTSLVGSLTRELRVIAELPGRDTLSQSLPGRRKDAKAARQTSARLLEAIQPLSDVLRPPAPALTAPDVVCAPEALDPAPYLRVLRWFLEGGESLRVLGFPDQVDALGPISAFLGGAMEKLAAARDKAPARTLVAVTDRRVLTARANAFLEQGEIRQEIPVGQVRYVRAASAQDRSGRRAVDLITRDESIRWLFRAGIDSAAVDALAAVLAESMTIPDAERDELLGRRRPAAEADERSGDAAAGAGTRSGDAAVGAGTRSGDAAVGAGTRSGDAAPGSAGPAAGGPG
ncbi:hypothetical protein [Streptomyces daghestanicus]|uniref:Uncharacterized protein n=1 Tax=Streptomyces daghestanicus TaxID=66885 RepID=A0ABQ3Q5Z3_9ACTN|nr:hypothetical protein [Streptomyces daghestanicus]GGU61230.1 hypothetical protein GCM10010259_59990 [Streptomyces daghestanicus]GHI32691.1 hypothetical protein Sdagh_44210 [Streptomyces daghestanicus]